MIVSTVDVMLFKPARVSIQQLPIDVKMLKEEETIEKPTTYQGIKLESIFWEIVLWQGGFKFGQDMTRAHFDPGLLSLHCVISFESCFCKLAPNLD